MVTTTHPDEYAPEWLAHAPWEYDAKRSRLTAITVAKQFRDGSQIDATVTNRAAAVEVI